MAEPSVLTRLLSVALEAVEEEAALVEEDVAVAATVAAVEVIQAEAAMVEGEVVVMVSTRGLKADHGLI